MTGVSILSTLSPYSVVAGEALLCVFVRASLMLTAAGQQEFSHLHHCVFVFFAVQITCELIVAGYCLLTTTTTNSKLLLRWSMLKSKIVLLSVALCLFSFFGTSFFQNLACVCSTLCCVADVWVSYRTFLELQPQSEVAPTTQKQETLAVSSVRRPNAESLWAWNGLTVTNDLLKTKSFIVADKVFTIGCFDLFHWGHAALLQRLRAFGRELIVGVHDDESIKLLKNLTPTDNTVERLKNVKKVADQVFAIPHTDPSEFLRSIIHLADGQTGVFVRGADMPNFPGRSVVEELMPVVFLPYSDGVSSSQLRRERAAAEAASSDSSQAAAAPTDKPRSRSGERRWWQDVNFKAAPAHGRAHTRSETRCHVQMGST